MAIQRSADEFHDQILIYKNSPINPVSGSMGFEQEWSDEETYI